MWALPKPESFDFLKIRNLELRQNSLILVPTRSPRQVFDFSLFNPYVWIHGPHHAMCPPLIRVRFCIETIYFFSVQFILNELSSSHFLTFEIFVKISSLESLATHHPKNRTKFQLSQNSTKVFCVTRFRETNPTA